MDDLAYLVRLLDSGHPLLSIAVVSLRLLTRPRCCLVFRTTIEAAGLEYDRTSDRKSSPFAVDAQLAYDHRRRWPTLACVEVLQASS